jgi:hypothetical protein
MSKVFLRVLSVAAGSVIYDLTTKPGWRSVDFKKAAFIFVFCWFVFWLEQKRELNTSKISASA